MFYKEKTEESMIKQWHTHPGSCLMLRKYCSFLVKLIPNSVPVILSPGYICSWAFDLLCINCKAVTTHLTAYC